MTHDSRWVTVDGRRLHARRWAGTGPAIVLVHGLVVSSRYMVPVGEELGTDHVVWAPDLPGFGQSGKPDHAPDVTELADALGGFITALRLDRPVLLANSFGCQIAIDLAVRRPELTRALVLAAPTIEPGRRTVPEQLARWQVEQATQSLALRAIQVRDYASAGLLRAVRTFRHALADRIEGKLDRVEAPTLVVRGSRDPICSQAWAEQVARDTPGDRLALIPGGLHAINHENPLELARVTRAFLATIDHTEQVQAA